MAKYKTSLKFIKITENSTIENDGYSAVCFVNRGDKDILINNLIKLKPGNTIAFCDEPYVVFDTDLYLQGEDVDVIVIKTYYYEI